MGSELNPRRRQPPPATCPHATPPRTKTQGKCGYGVVAEEELSKGDFAGEVIDERTWEKRLWKIKRQQDTNFDLCEVTSNMVTDASKKGNMSLFVNHSCEPNMEIKKRTVDGEIRVDFFALRDIKKGEELTYNYKFMQCGADQDCHRTSHCRKKLGTPKSVESIVINSGISGIKKEQHVSRKRKIAAENCIGQSIRLWHRQHNMYFPAVVHDFNAHTGLHTILVLKDNGTTIEEFNMMEEDWDFLPG
uniref:SET domain-containing protein n=1 Tax=Leersia perrieri TaxID=77586 RepID=A0A0D9WXD4_9ORYZ